MCLPVVPLGPPEEGQGALLELRRVALNPHQILSTFGVFPGSQNKGPAAWALLSGGMVKHYFGTETSEILMGKRYFGKVLF